MTQIDFYITNNPDGNAHDLLVCRIAEKAFAAKTPTYIHTGSAQHAGKMDKLLWIWRDQSFIPHQLYSDPDVSNCPVLIGHDHEPETNTDILINLCGDVPDFFSRFERVIEIVPNDISQRQRSRERYKFYKDRGYNIATHNV